MIFSTCIHESDMIDDKMFPIINEMLQRQEQYKQLEIASVLKS